MASRTEFLVSLRVEGSEALQRLKDNLDSISSSSSAGLGRASDDLKKVGTEAKGASTASDALKGLDSSAQQAAASVGKVADSAKTSNTNLGKVGRTAKKAGTDTKKAAKDVGTFDNALLSASKTAQLIDGPLGGVAARITTLRSALGNVNPAFIALSLGIGGLLKILKDSVTAASALERQMLTLDAVLRATGSVAGLTAEQIDGLARSLDLATLFSAEGVRDAAAALATFPEINTENFERTIKVSADLAAVMGGDLRSNAIRLGRALEDPEGSLTSLRRAGITFTEEQRELILVLQETGNAAAAQDLVLQKIEARLGGTAEGQAQGLAGVVDAVSFNWTNLLEQLAETSRSSVLAESSLSRINTLLVGTTRLLEAANEGFRTLFGGVETDIGFGIDAASFSGLDEIDKQIAQLKSSLEGLDINGVASASVKLSIQRLESQRELLASQKESVQSFIDADIEASKIEDTYTRIIRAARIGVAAVVPGGTQLNTFLAGIEAARVTSPDEAIERGRKTFQELQKLEIENEKLIETTKTKIEEEETKKRIALREKSLDEIRQETIALSAQGQSRITRGVLDNELAELGALREQGLTTLEDYYDRRLALQEQKLDVERDALLAKQRQLTEALEEEQEAINSTNREGLRLAEERAVKTGSEVNFNEIKETETLLELISQQVQVATELGDISTRVTQTRIRNAREETKALASQSRAQTEFRNKLLEEQATPIPLRATVDSEELAKSIGEAVEQVRAGYDRMIEQAETAFPEGSDQAVRTVEALFDKRALETEFDLVADLIRRKITEIQTVEQIIERDIDLGTSQESSKIVNARVEVSELKNEINELVVSLQPLAEQDIRLDEEFTTLTREVESATTATDELAKTTRENAKRMAEDLSAGLATGIQDFISGTEGAERSFRQFASSFLADISKMIIQQQILNALRNSGLIPGLAAGGSTSTAAASSGGYIPAHTSARRGAPLLASHPIQYLANGGRVKSFEVGGRVRGPGTGISDSIPARLSMGEYVIKAAAVRKYGVGFFELLNKMSVDWNKASLPQAKSITMPKMKRFNTGGFVSSESSTQANKDQADINSTVDLQIINTLDPSEVLGSAIATPSGRKVLLNFISGNKRIINGALN